MAKILELQIAGTTGASQDVKIVEEMEETFQEDVCDVCGLVIDWRCAMEIQNRKKGTEWRYRI